MSKNNRVKLSPRQQEAMAFFANQVPAGAETNPDDYQLPVAKDEQEIAEIDTATEVDTEVDTEVAETDTDGDWTDELTLPEAPQEQQEQQEPQDLPSTEQHDNETDDDYIARVREEFKNLEHIDEEVADEIFEKAVYPVLKHQDEVTNSRVQALEKRLAEVQHNTASLQQERAAKRFDDTNQPILAKHPKASKILQSNEFKEFVNKTTNPYATETNYELLGRAYQLGNSDYVIEALDAFVASRKKPKPPVNADANASTARSSANRPNRMTEAEFLKQRRAIMANPRKYPKGALRKLELDFFSQK